jgi:short-subunit dehydrogenase
MTYSEFHDLPEFKSFERSQIPSFMWMKAEKVVEMSLSSLRNTNTVTFIPGFVNKALKLIGNLPFMSDMLAGMEDGKV